MLQHKSTIGILFIPYTELITMQVNQFLLVFILHNLKTMEAHCQARCELTNGRTTDTGLANREMVGHSFKNFTLTGVESTDSSSIILAVVSNSAMPE